MASNDAGRSVSHSSFSGDAHIFQGDVNISKAKINIDVHDTESDAILSNLPVVEGAAFDAHANEHEPRCHPGTRVKILEEIVKWAQDPHRKRIYWLCGMAGTGKSTICRTVAHDLSSMNITAASFFFKKGDGNRDKSGALFTTIVKQLVEYLPKEMAIHVKQALRENPSISDKSLSKQFEELILAPLKRCKSLPPVIIFVLDALDECDNQANAARIIELLPNVETVSSTSFKVLVSSRPECHLRKSFAQLNCKYEEILLQMTLHEVADEDVWRDMFIFLVSQLRQIRDSYNDTNLKFPADWPSQSLVKDLVDTSMPLFIMAATACRFISDEDLGVPVTLAQEFLLNRKFGKGNPLARTYLPILEQLLVKRNGTRVEDRSKVEKERIIGEFRRVVGTIVLLEAPLSIHSLSHLLEMDSWEIGSRLSSLHSILHVPKNPDYPVKLFHLSFRDFLTGADHQEEKHDFFVDERETHASIARQCVALLSKDDNLKQDICKLSHPATLRSDIDQETLDSCLPLHIRYACLHWVFHLKKGGGHIDDDDEAYRFLTNHLIHWLEALSLLGCIANSHDMVDTLLTMVDDNGDLASLLRDSKRFIRTYQHVMDIAPLQLYCSALIFAPMKSKFRQCFETEIPRWIKNRPAVEMNWDALLQVLEDNVPAERVVFSPDSSLIASLSRKKVTIWRSHTGNCVHELKFDSFSLITRAIEFSCDSKLLYVAFSNGEVTSWETDAWTCSTVIEADRKLDVNVFAMAFSPDCKLLAMAFAERIEIRSIPSGGDLIERIIINDARRLMFSPDSTYISARVLSDQSFRMWPVHGGQPIWIKAGLALAYSPDSSFVALSITQTIGYAIEIHRVGEGSFTFYRKFPLDNDGLDGVYSLAFSHDAALLAMGKSFGKIEIRLADTGECIWAAADAHTLGISSLSFSHDSALLVSSSDGAVHVYSVDKHRSARIPESKRGEVGSITISPDSSLILLKPGEHNKIWQIFQTASSACLREIDRHMVQGDPAFTPGSALAMIKDGAAEIWHPDRHPRIQNLEGLGSEPSDIRASCFSTDFTLAAGILKNGSLRIWQMDTGACIRVVKSALWDIDRRSPRFSPDASHIACGSYKDSKLLVWQVNSVAHARKFNVSRGFHHFALSNTKLAMASANSVEIWSLKTGEFLLRFIDTNQQYLDKLTISCDSTLLASTPLYSIEPNITIWNAHTGTSMVAIDLSYPITHFTFEPNNSGLLTNVGRIKFKNPIASSAVIAKDSQSQPWYHDGLGFCNDDSLDNGSWISFNGKKLIWLPMKYRGRRGISRAVSESVIAIVHTFGRNAFIEFDTEWISSEYGHTQQIKTKKRKADGLSL